nr:fibronectin type III domain-containing protein [uncultured Treponema sp.]
MKKIKLALLLSFVVALTSCSVLFENRVPMNIDKPGSNLGVLISGKEKKEKLDTPAQIYVSNASYSNKIVVSWTPVDRATSYYIERAVSVKDENGSYPVPTDSEYDTLPFCQRYYGTVYEDVILKDPEYSSSEYECRYYYRVCADNPRDGYKSSDFAVSTAGSLLAPPNTVSASLGESKEKIEVTWSSVPGARSYEIYRSLNSDGTASKKIGTVSGNERRFVNSVSKEEQGKNFYYTVYSVNSTGRSCESSLTLGYSLEDGACGAVTGVAVVNGDGKSADPKFQVSWNSVSVEGKDVCYALYRNSSKDSTRVLIKELSATSYEDVSNIEPGVFYYYQVQAYYETSDEAGNTKKVKGPFSKSGADSTNPAEGYLLSAPSKGKVATNKEDKTKCSICFTAALGSLKCNTPSKIANDKVYSYEIFYGAEKDGNYTSLGVYTDSQLDAYFNQTTKMYEIPNIDTQNFFYIVTISGGTKSKPGNVFASSPMPVRNLKATKAAFIDGLTNSESMANEKGVFSTVVSWEPSASNDAEGGYRLFRSESPDSGWHKIAELEKDKLEFIDSVQETNEGASPGTVYYYRVLSLNADKEGDNYSDVVYGYGALTAKQYLMEYNKTIKNSHTKLTLMHKSATSKIGSETAKGTISGDLYYNAKMASGLRGDVTMKYTNYADYYIDDKHKELGPIFICNGNSNTNSSLSDGYMFGTVTCTGMYPGSVGYDDIKIVSQKAGGGTYLISRDGFEQEKIDWTFGEE